jgi:hypothetical protein
MSACKNVCIVSLETGYKQERRIYESELLLSAFKRWEERERERKREREGERLKYKEGLQNTKIRIYSTYTNKIQK